MGMLYCRAQLDAVVTLLDGERVAAIGPFPPLGLLSAPDTRDWAVAMAMASLCPYQIDAGAALPPGVPETPAVRIQLCCFLPGDAWKMGKWAR